MTDETEQAWREHGYYEVFIPVWNPEDETQPVNMTVDIIGDEESLNDISSGLVDSLAEYGKDDSQMTRDEQYIGNHLRSILDAGLVMEARCESLGITSVDDLRNRLDDEDFEVFPL